MITKKKNFFSFFNNEKKKFISPFIRPKISKLQDAAAMEQREACKLFEKVLVQNIRFGLSPSLTKAIASVSR